MIRQQMSSTVSVSELTSHDVNKLQRQLDSHDALMNDLAALDAQLQAIKSHTDIAGEFNTAQTLS